MKPGAFSGSPEHDPENWKPVFRKDHAQTKKPERDVDPSDSSSRSGTAVKV
jgi:hypothetical protein